MLTISAILDFQFDFLTNKKFSRVSMCSSIFYNSKKMDQRICIEFDVKNEIKCARTLEMLIVAFGESSKSRSQVQLWYNRFKEGREDVNDDARPGLPSTSTTDENIEAVKKMIENDE